MNSVQTDDAFAQTGTMTKPEPGAVATGCAPRISIPRGTRSLPLPVLYFLFAFLFLACHPEIKAQFKPVDYARTEAMIPMRDGVRLYTTIDAPTSASGPLPILLLRTPYGLGEIKPEQLAT